MRLAKISMLVFCLSTSPLIFADAPVVDLSQSNQAQSPDVTGPVTAVLPDTSSLPMDQRVGRLEQQMSNFSQMNMPSRIDQLQQQVNQLQGQLEESQHQLQALQDQQKSFYQDLTQQINQLKPAGVATGGKVSAAQTDTMASTAPSGSASEQSAYQATFNLLAAKKYDQAVSGFQTYLQQYPKGQFAANAHYWLGEIYFLQNKMNLAGKEFQTILDQYPKDQKVPDAMLKLAFINDSTGKKDQARQQLKEIIKHYPGTAAAQLATMRLKS